MPRLSQWIIKTALVYLMLGFSVGGLILIQKGVPFNPIIWTLLPAHIEFLLMGWVVQLTLGVAFWILPRYWTSPRRPNEHFVAVAYILLNVGIWLVVVGTVLRAGPWAVFAGRAAEIGAVVFFALHGWPRIVGREGA